MRAVALCLLLFPSVAWAAGSDTPIVTKPKPTPTTETCKGVQVWDPATQKCVNPQGSSLNQRLLEDAVRALAYAGRNADAQGVLAALRDQDSDLALTYWGFTHRRLGNVDQAMMFYARALDRNPDNLMARSYLGQAHVEAGRMMAARTELREIRARGGAGLWPERSLATAIETGGTFDY